MFWSQKKSRENELQKIFSKFLPEPVVSIASLGIDGNLKPATVDFVLFVIEHEDCEKFGMLFSEAVAIALAHRATVMGTAGGVTQLVVGPREGEDDCSRYRASLANELVDTLGNAIRVVHGRGVAHVGAVGTENRVLVGIFPLRIVEILRLLAECPKGRLIELSNGSG
jgi:hypothetical protein